MEISTAADHPNNVTIAQKLNPTFLVIVKAHFTLAGLPSTPLKRHYVKGGSHRSFWHPQYTLKHPELRVAIGLQYRGNELRLAAVALEATVLGAVSFLGAVAFVGAALGISGLPAAVLAAASLAAALGAALVVVGLAAVALEATVLGAVSFLGGAAFGVTALVAAAFTVAGLATALVAAGLAAALAVVVLLSVDLDATVLETVTVLVVTVFVVVILAFLGDTQGAVLHGFQKSHLGSRLDL
ncbi:hypothetical protein HAV15_007740 [Penicillium sp. str. |nr:hypothetical protein HAV15_007740 [Penicillium sp. str. \